VYSAPTSPGAHTVYLTALSSNLYPLFTASSPVTTSVSSAISNQMGLRWAVGGVVVSWQLESRTNASQVCSAVNSPNVWVNFVNSDVPNGIYPGKGDKNACTGSDPAYYVTRYFYLPAYDTGTNYRIDMSADTDTTSATWSALTAPVITVVPGVFPAD